MSQRGRDQYISRRLESLQKTRYQNQVTNSESSYICFDSESEPTPDTGINYPTARF
jgi:hypothetical protein